MACLKFAHPPLPILPFLLAQNLSSKWIVPTDNVAQVRRHQNASSVVKELMNYPCLNAGEKWSHDRFWHTQAAWEEEKVAWYALFVNARANMGMYTIQQLLAKPLYYTDFCKSVNFVHLKDACHEPPSVEMMMWKWWKYSPLHLQELSVHNGMWWCNWFPLKFTDHLKQANVECYCQNHGSSDFKTSSNVSDKQHNSILWPSSR